MFAVVAQEFEIFEAVEPVIVVDHCGGQKVFIVAVIVDELGEAGCADAFHVGFDIRIGEEFALFVFEAWVADFGGAAAHEGDDFVTALLEPIEHHDAGEIADMQGFCGGVEAYVGGLGAFAEFGVEGVEI